MFPEKNQENFPVSLKMNTPCIFEIQIILKKLLLHLKSQLYLGVWARPHKRHEPAMPGMKADSKAEQQKGKEVIQNASVLTPCQAGDRKGGKSGNKSKQLSHF